jgi:hypothetical protein
MRKRIRILGPTGKVASGFLWIVQVMYLIGSKDLFDNFRIVENTFL